MEQQGVIDFTTGEILDEALLSDGVLQLDSSGDIVGKPNEENQDKSWRVDYTKNEENDKDPESYRMLVSNLAELYMTIKDQITTLEAKKKKIASELLDLVGPGTTMVLENGLEVRTYDETTRNRFDTTRFKKDNPEEYKEYLKESHVSAYAQVTGKLIEE